MDATGISRYLPVLVYPKGAPEKAAYIRPPPGEIPARGQPDVDAGNRRPTPSGSVDAMQKAVEHIRKDRPQAQAASPTEFGFLPYDASQVLRAAFPDAEWVDALFVLERQRVKKSAEELKSLKCASEAVIDRCRR